VKQILVNQNQTIALKNALRSSADEKPSNKLDLKQIKHLKVVMQAPINDYSSMPPSKLKKKEQPKDSIRDILRETIA
jgi:hypothetical protein